MDDCSTCTPAQHAKQTFGLRLRELRRARGLSQESLAERAGLDRTYVSSCERGHRNISLENIYRLAAALGVEPSELLKQPADDARQAGA
jgi:transcriptional regulator with XRE-family HTH domain